MTAQLNEAPPIIQAKMNTDEQSLCDSRGLLCIKAAPFPRLQLCLNVIKLPLLSGFCSVIAVGEPLVRRYTDIFFLDLADLFAF